MIRFSCVQRLATCRIGFYDESVPAEDVPILTDDYAPVDTLVPLYQWTPARRP